MSSSRTRIVVLALAVLALCWGRGYPLIEPDEGRNVEVAREMARDGDFVLPHLDGLPYLDKPATYFVAVALSLRAFGTSEGAARLPSLLFTLATIAIAWKLGERMQQGSGPPAAIALATMPLVLAFSRTVIFDSALLFLETLTLYGCWRALSDERDAKPWAAFAWAVMGVGAIVKGPVAIIVPVLIIVAYGLLAGVRLGPLFRLSAWPWLLVTGLPWFVAVSLRRPDFPLYAFLYESLQRVGTRTHGRGGPLWYFIPVGLAASFPWCVPAIAAAARAWRARAARRTAEARPAVFLAAWALVPLVFFSLSQSKLPGYYLPALPAIALAAGLLVSATEQDKSRAGTLRTWAAVAGSLLALVGALLITTAGQVAERLPTSLERTAYPSFAGIFGLALALCGLLAVVGAVRREVPLTLVALALPCMLIPPLGGGLLEAIARGRSSKDLARAIDAQARGATVVGVAAYPTSLRFYLDRPVLLSTEHASELTSNYIVNRHHEFRTLELTPLRPARWWREALAACAAPTVFVAHVASPEDSALAAQLPLIGRGGADERFAAYGPCRARAP